MRFRWAFSRRATSRFFLLLPEMLAPGGEQGHNPHPVVWRELFREGFEQGAAGCLVVRLQEDRVARIAPRHEGTVGGPA